MAGAKLTPAVGAGALLLTVVVCASAPAQARHLSRPARATSTASTSSTATSTPPPPPPPAAASWVGDYEPGSLSQFQNATWNYLPAAPSVVTDPVRSGVYAAAYTIPAGGSRCETVPNVRAFVEGDDLYFTVSTYLAPGFPVNAATWQVLTQWKNDGTGSPPVELKVDSGYFRVDGGYGWPGNTSSPKPKYASTSVGTAVAGQWDDWTFHIKFSSNPTVGSVDVWRNGTPVITGWHMPGGTLYPNLTSYWKNGYYRDSAISTQGVVYEDDLKVSAGP